MESTQYQGQNIVSGTSDRKVVGVRVPLWVHIFKKNQILFRELIIKQAQVVELVDTLL